VAYKAILVNLPTLQAGEDLDDYQYYFVKLNGDGDVVTMDSTDEGTDEPIGVLQYNPDDGISATVAVAGVTKLVAGEDNLDAGDYVATDDDGKAVEAADDDFVYGRVIEGGDEDEIISVLIGYVPTQLNTT